MGWSEGFFFFFCFFFSFFQGAATSMPMVSSRMLILTLVAAKVVATSQLVWLFNLIFRPIEFHIGVFCLHFLLKICSKARDIMRKTLDWCQGVHHEYGLMNTHPDFLGVMLSISFICSNISFNRQLWILYVCRFCCCCCWMTVCRFYELDAISIGWWWWSLFNFCYVKHEHTLLTIFELRKHHCCPHVVLNLNSLPLNSFFFWYLHAFC